MRRAVAPLISRVFLGAALAVACVFVPPASAHGLVDRSFPAPNAVLTTPPSSATIRFNEPVDPVFKTLAPENGYLHVGPSGAGHFTKMIHNGIEYGMLQAYGEGFEILKASPFKPDLGKVAHLWNRGSVVRSWLLELAELAFSRDPDLSKIKGYVEDSGEGRWTIQEAIDRDVPAPVLALSLFARFRSRQDDSFAAKVIAALRNEFGGHSVRPQ